eukprot:CAMPEP_0177492988 /NCGR_PEP_ID=MMETSP0369-20130122/32652_1 /TAXON_ID=447022 ORGANISM="Scrippsiella hangoei-like, Strain SHHI-4" /NCGR_SAMPLE_ID=MMETSP0369 /ASSEMBLY_ACC=CAM_ASM_000364 /LENGTH=41 /DNA_ID= /DNA_START= /DNA_END= /DNA_ORIENTATION=
MGESQDNILAQPTQGYPKHAACLERRLKMTTSYKRRGVSSS